MGKVSAVKAGRTPNPCYAAPLEKRLYPSVEWGLRLPFTLSNVQLSRYADVQGHKVPQNWDNCYDEQTEILTARGWIKFSDLLIDDVVAQWWPNGDVNFVAPSGYTCKPYAGKLIRLQGHAVDLLVTPTHRILSKSQYCQRWNTAVEWLRRKPTNWGDRKFIRGGRRKDGRRLTDVERCDLVAAIVIQAEGWIRKNTTEVSVRSLRKTTQLKARFGDRVKVRGTSKDRVKVLFQNDEGWSQWLTTNPKVFRIEKLLELCADDLDFFLDEVMLWDGSIWKRLGRFAQRIDRLSAVEAVQIAATLTGRSTKIHFYQATSPMAIVSVHPSAARTVSIITCEEEDYTGDIYCVTVPSGAILVRRNYKVIVSGNSPPTPRFDEDALRDLLAKYPADPLYPLIKRYRQVEKALGTYVEGMRPGPDGRVHGTFNHRPKTLRLAMQSPSLQVIPRGDDPDSPYARIKSMFECSVGSLFASRDFGGIEAVIVAYLAGDRDLLRLTQIDVHSFLAAHAVKRPADLAWSDEDLIAHFKALRKTQELFTLNGRTSPFDVIRTGCKRALYLSLYGGTPTRMVQAEPQIFPTKLVGAWYQDLIFNRFPSITKWQWATCEEAETYGYVTAPDGFRMHAHDVFAYQFSKREKRWIRKFGEAAKEVIAAKPQHLAMTYMAQALVTLWEDYPEIAEGLRLSIHDDITGEWGEDMIELATATVREVMGRPLMCLPLPPEWGMGTHLSIASEAKVGRNWGAMSKLKE